MSQHAIDNAAAWWQNIKEMVAELDAAIEESTIRDRPGVAGYDETERTEAAKRTIEESALSVEVRDGWRTPGVEVVGNAAEEYAILLSTGGPALRIYGRLDRYGEPDLDPLLQWQDWGTPWTDYWPPDSNDIPYKDTLRTFASQFYFGD